MNSPGTWFMSVSLMVFALFQSSVLTAGAQMERWEFSNRRYFDPLRAEVRSAQISVLFPAFSDPVEFSPNTGDRFTAWDITLGSEIPLVGWETESSATADLTPGNFGFGLWLPISFHMIEDMEDGDNSRPIINTDYRFSAMAKAQWKAWENASIQGRLAIGHESTHLGDEFSLLAFRTAPGEFRRINVSYESIDYGASFQHLPVLPFLGESELLLRHTGVYAFNERGYYTPHLPESGGGPVVPSKRRYQWGVGAQLVPDRKWRPWISAEIRNRIVYGYDRPSPELKERTKASINLMVGTRLSDLDLQALGAVELYLRYYHGVNPAGQFRNSANYSLYGVGVLVRIGGR